MERNWTGTTITGNRCKKRMSADILLGADHTCGCGKGFRAAWAFIATLCLPLVLDQIVNRTRLVLDLPNMVLFQEIWGNNMCIRVAPANYTFERGWRGKKKVSGHPSGCCICKLNTFLAKGLAILCHHETVHRRLAASPTNKTRIMVFFLLHNSNFARKWLLAGSALFGCARVVPTCRCCGSRSRCRCRYRGRRGHRRGNRSGGRGKGGGRGRGRDSSRR